MIPELWWEHFGVLFSLKVSFSARYHFCVPKVVPQLWWEYFLAVFHQVSLFPYHGKKEKVCPLLLEVRANICNKQHSLGNVPSAMVEATLRMKISLITKMAAEGRRKILGYFAYYRI